MRELLIRERIILAWYGSLDVLIGFQNKLFLLNKIIFIIRIKMKNNAAKVLRETSGFLTMIVSFLFESHLHFFQISQDKNNVNIVYKRSCQAREHKMRDNCIFR